jgi:FKBP-type peptidyl-prolyl cis-trans isomerase SlyD
MNPKEKLMRAIQWALVLSLAAVELFSPGSPIAAQGTKDEKVVKDGAVVSLQYTLSGEDGKTIESNKGQEPMKYTQGARQIIPGLEKGLAGMKIGEQKRVKVKPEDGYGPVNAKAFQEVPKEKIPPESLKAGAPLVANGPQGQSVPVRVHQVKEKTVVIDMNHPMAGKTLVFDVKILDIQPAAATQPPKPAQPAAPPQPAKPAQPK